jgi:hypothetical protein
MTPLWIQQLSGAMESRRSEVGLSGIDSHIDKARESFLLIDRSISMRFNNDYKQRNHGALSYEEGFEG